MSESTSPLMSRWDAEDWEYDEETGGLVHLLRADEAVQAGLWKPGKMRAHNPARVGGP